MLSQFVFLRRLVDPKLVKCVWLVDGEIPWELEINLFLMKFLFQLFLMRLVNHGMMMNLSGFLSKNIFALVLKWENRTLVKVKKYKVKIEFLSDRFKVILVGLLYATIKWKVLISLFLSYKEWYHLA